MILPNVRASFGRREAEFLLSLAGAGGEERLRSEGIDVLLDDAAVVRAMLRRRAIDVAAPAPLVFYLLVRQALLEREIHDRQLADYTAAVLLEFGRLGRTAARDDTLPGSHYLADILTEIERARGDQEFRLRAHLGNLALWLAGVFPDHITSRVQRRGAPPLSYYDELGAAGFRSAGAMSLALQYGVGDLFIRFADEFAGVRSALNGLSDALFFPKASDGIERVLREVTDRFNRNAGKGYR